MGFLPSLPNLKWLPSHGWQFEERKIPPAFTRNLCSSSCALRRFDGKLNSSVHSQRIRKRALGNQRVCYLPLLRRVRGNWSIGNDYWPMNQFSRTRLRRGWCFLGRMFDGKLNSSVHSQRIRKRALGNQRVCYLPLLRRVRGNWSIGNDYWPMNQFSRTRIGGDDAFLVECLMESSIAQSSHKGLEKERWEIKG